MRHERNVEVKCSGHDSSVETVTMSKDERRAVSGSNDCSVRVWEV